MAKVDKFMEGRNEGMAFALKIAKEQGIEALEQEVKMRRLTFLPSAVPKKALEECIQRIKDNTLDTYTILLVATLHDEFGFGQKRIQRAIDRFDSKAEAICDDMTNWDDYIDAIKEDLGLELSIRKNDSDVRY